MLLQMGNPGELDGNRLQGASLLVGQPTCPARCPLPRQRLPVCLPAQHRSTHTGRPAGENVARSFSPGSHSADIRLLIRSPPVLLIKAQEALEVSCSSRMKGRRVAALHPA